MESNTIYDLRKKHNSLPPSKIAREIRILAEVEKIWILFDLDENGVLDFGEIS